tara:strand:+ start:283 stop:510 length:228 start_codon:yes stop_codon:yes gene_type:complete
VEQEHRAKDFQVVVEHITHIEVLVAVGQVKQVSITMQLQVLLMAEQELLQVLPAVQLLGLGEAVEDKTRTLAQVT